MEELNIYFVPQRLDEVVKYVKRGDSVYVNGVEFDFSQLKENELLPRESIDSEWFCGDVFRDSTGLNIHLKLPNPINYSEEQAFPKPLINVEDGEIFQPSSTEE